MIGLHCDNSGWQRRRWVKKCRLNVARVTSAIAPRSEVREDQSWRPFMMPASHGETESGDAMPSLPIRPPLQQPEKCARRFQKKMTARVPPSPRMAAACKAAAIRDCCHLGPNSCAPQMTPAHMASMKQSPPTKIIIPSSSNTSPSLGNLCFSLWRSATSVQPRASDARCRQQTAVPKHAWAAATPNSSGTARDV